ncbi:MAG: hypothetical protein KGR46_01705 [Verrucomicrobia bacterium]|nr:hypothetical protein [Verrucomicrobiota bacterium]
MKSAYELAMERLEKVAPAAQLSAEQKARLAEVDQQIDAEIAGKRVFLEGQLAKAEFHEQDSIRRQLASEIARLEEKREREKGKIRSATGMG